LTGAFAAAHAFYYAIGGRFDAAPLKWYWQFVDPVLLRQRLIASVFYLHSQPPLYNLFLGAVLKVFPRQYASAFQVVYLLFGLGLLFCLFRLQVKLGVGRVVAIIVSAAFVASPPFFLYEHWLFYTFPLAALVTAAALLFYEVLSAGRTWAVAALVVVVAVIAFGPRRIRRRVVLIAAAPFILLLSLHVKNYAWFGELHLSSWSGMYLWQISGENLTPRETEILKAEGEMSPVFPVPAFSDLSAYPDSYRRPTRYEDVPVLADPKKSSDCMNLHHIAYVSISKDYLHDSLRVMRRFPRAYLRGLAKSWYVYFKASSGDMGGYTILGHVLKPGKVAVVTEAFERVFFLKTTWRRFLTKVCGETPGTVWLTAYPVLLVVLPLLAIYGIRLSGNKGAAAAGLSREQRLTVAFICGHIVYVCVAANMCAYAENNRMRFVTDPFFLTLAALFAHRYVFRPRRNRPSPPPPSAA
jgi:hypothetical protein